MVIAHCKAVAEVALETARVCRKKGIKVNVDLVEAGALLHDIGRSETHSVDHAVVGAQIARAEGLPEAVVAIIERHVGGGITGAEAKALGWPPGEYVPATLEEKIVSYADKLVETSNERMPIELTITRLKEEKLETAAQRVQNLHNEITKLIEE
jgi:uncharacterized protein